ncbi:MAG: RluA family pseudouridine synthase [Flavobacteriales bacterium]|nr:RluA family pseudouridine synthase [Flavobacteriales bacterium]
MAEKSIEILFEDNHIIAVNKPSGLLVQGDKTGDETLADLVKAYIKKTKDKPGDVYLGIVHRLDRPVSGVVLFAKTSKALVRLNKMFAERETKKIYWAVVTKRPQEETGKLVHWLRKDEEKNRSKAFNNEMKHTKFAELDYKMLRGSDRYTLLEVYPKTGRHHQIRVQLSKIGCSIKGDLKYGFNRSNSDGSIHLHARAIQFTHPVSGESIKITAPAPITDPVWKYFNEVCGG